MWEQRNKAGIFTDFKAFRRYLQNGRNNYEINRPT